MSQNQIAPKYIARLQVLRDCVTVHIIDLQPSGPKWLDLLPWMAFVISITSLAFSINQGMEARRHDRLSVTPYLHMYHFGETAQAFGISLENDGVGPAIIQRVDILYNNKNYYSIRSFYDELLKTLPKTYSGRLVYTDISGGEFYRSGANPRRIIEGTDMEPKIRSMVWDQITGKLEIRVNYCSVYQECYAECLIAAKEVCKKLSLQATLPSPGP